MSKILRMCLPIALLIVAGCVTVQAPDGSKTRGFGVVLVGTAPDVIVPVSGTVNIDGVVQVALDEGDVGARLLALIRAYEEGKFYDLAQLDPILEMRRESRREQTLTDQACPSMRDSVATLELLLSGLSQAPIPHQAGDNGLYEKVQSIYRQADQRRHELSVAINTHCPTQFQKQDGVWVVNAGELRPPEQERLASVQFGLTNPALKHRWIGDGELSFHVLCPKYHPDDAESPPLSSQRFGEWDWNWNLVGNWSEGVPLSRGGV